MNHSQISSTSENHFKKQKKSIPINIMSNTHPLQFIFNNKKSNLATSYINMGNQIQKNKNLNIISVSKKNTAQTLGNKNIITQSHLSNSILSKSNLSNNTQLKFSTYRNLNDSNKTSDYSALFKTKIIKTLNNKKNSGNNSFNKVNKNNTFNNRNNKKQNIKINRKVNNKNIDFSKETLISTKNKSKEQENKNIDCTNKVSKNKNNILEKNKVKKIFYPFTKNLHNYIKSDNSFFASSFITKNKEKELLNNKLNKIKIQALKKNKVNKGNKTKNSINKPEKKFDNKNQTISININTIFKDIKVDKKNNINQNKKTIKNQIKNNNENKSPLKTIEKKKETPKKEITEIKEMKKENPIEINILSSSRNTKNINNINNYNNIKNKNFLLESNNLNNIPVNLDDKFDNLNLIVRKIHFEKVLINCGNLFSIKNKKYDKYIENFNMQFNENEKFNNNNKTTFLLNTLQSNSTQQD